MATKQIDTVTVLQAVGRRFYGKKFIHGKSYDQSGERPVWHTITLEKVTGLLDWSRLHHRYRGNRRVCVTRNKAKDHDSNASEMRVRNGERQYRRQKVNFIDEPHHWVMFDFDNAHINKFDWHRDPEQAVREAVHRYLPKAFRNTDFFWFYSASQGITKGQDGKVNAHVVFWMDRRVANFEWRAWLVQHGLGDQKIVDVTLFRDTQPHYVNDPILEDTPDPFTAIPRSGMYEGKSAVVEFELDDSFVEEPESTAVYSSDSKFDMIKRFQKSDEANAFNKFTKMHEVLTHFGFVLKTTTGGGKYPRRYLDPDSTSGVAGVGVNAQDELHSFHDSGLFRTDKHYDAFEAYLMLTEHERRREMQAVGMDFDELSEEFTERTETEVDPAEALAAIDMEQAFAHQDSPALVARCLAHKLTVLAALEWLNRHYFMLTSDTENIFNWYKIRDPKKGKELGFHRKAKVGDLMQFKFQNSYIERDDDGNQMLISRPVNIIKAFLAWRDHRHYDDVGLYFGKGTADQYDIWEGYAVEPHSGDWSMLRYHMETVLCQNDPVKLDYLLDLLASWIQRPDEKYGVALVLIGDKGTGKNAFFDFLATLYNPAQVLCDSNPDTFFGNFNSMLMGKVLVGLDEVGFGGDHTTGRKLKTLVTQPSIVINRKGVPALDTHNHTHLIFMSNEKWAVQTSRDERRFFVLQMSNIHQQETAYFDRLWAAIKDRRVQAAFLADMMSRTVERNVRQIVRTDTLKDIAVYSESVVIRWLMDMLEFGVCNHIQGHAIEYMVDEKDIATEKFYERLWEGQHPDWDTFVPTFLLRQDFQIYLDKNRVNYRATIGQLSHEIAEVFENKAVQVWSRPEEEPGGARKKYNGFHFPKEDWLRERLGQEAPEKKSADFIVDDALREFRRAGIHLVPEGQDPGKDE
jgi:hypothetical protein